LNDRSVARPSSRGAALNNRDGMGQFLDLTKNSTKTFLEWTPTVMHDVHEAQT
jgi:hypothetical protein